MLGCIGVSLTINGSPLLSGVSFALQPGGCVIVEGPSGSGKTQLVRLLLREMDPTGGAIEVDGVNLQLLPPPVLQLYRQRVGTVFQDPRLLGSMTIAENVALPTVLRTRDERGAGSAALEILSALGIAETANALPKDVAPGALRLASIGRALCGKPSIIIADEPFAALDDAQRALAAQCLQTAHHAGASLLLLTQHAAAMASFGGTTVSIGTPQQRPPVSAPPATASGNVRITPVGR